MNQLLLKTLTYHVSVLLTWKKHFGLFQLCHRELDFFLKKLHTSQTTHLSTRNTLRHIAEAYLKKKVHTSLQTTHLSALLTSTFYTIHTFLYVTHFATNVIYYTLYMSLHVAHLSTCYTLFCLAEAVTQSNIQYKHKCKYQGSACSKWTAANNHRLCIQQNREVARNQPLWLVKVLERVGVEGQGTV